MKLRNKKTGKIVEYGSIGFRKGLSNGWEDWMDALREDCQVEIIGNINENPELLEGKK